MTMIMRRKFAKQADRRTASSRRRASHFRKSMTMELNRL